MSLYEFTFIMRQDIANSEMNKISEKMRHAIKENGGKVLKEEYWGLRNLAYMVKKNKKGHYIMLVFSAPNAQAIKEVKRIVSISEDIIRDLLIRIAEFDNKDSIIMKESKVEER